MFGARDGDSQAPANQGTLRRANLGLMMSAICAAQNPPSRADIATRTGVTRSTASRLVDELIEGGLIVEMSPLAGMRGRPAVPLAASSHVLAIGVEINVYRVVVMIVDLSGSVIKRHIENADIPSLGPHGALELVARISNQLLDELPGDAADRCFGARIALPGLIDRSWMHVLRAPNLHWSNIPNLHWSNIEPWQILDECGFRHDDWQKSVSNDIDCSALTIMQTAPGRTTDNASFLYISGEVGIGAAAAMDGKLVGGHHGWATELGHVCVDPDGPICPCGSHGCLEAYAGRLTMLDAAGADDLDDLFERVASGDRQALDVVERTGWALGVAVSSALNLLDVTQVMLGGHLNLLAPWLVPVMRQEIGKRVLWADYEDIDLTTAPHADTRSALGAAYSVLNQIIADHVLWLDGDHPLHHDESAHDGANESSDSADVDE